MCDPVSAMIGLSIAGTAVSAAGQIAQGNSAAEMGALQQQAYESQARSTAKASAFEQAQERRKQELVAANARAQVGASGVALEGSPGEVLMANAGQGELDIQAIQFGSNVRQGQLRTQGALAKYSGDQAKKAGYIAGASTLLSGAGRAIQLGRGGSVFK